VTVNIVYTAVAEWTEAMCVADRTILNLSTPSGHREQFANPDTRDTLVTIEVSSPRTSMQCSPC
jgi:hypothetical protein